MLLVRSSLTTEKALALMGGVFWASGGQEKVGIIRVFTLRRITYHQITSYNLSSKMTETTETGQMTETSEETETVCDWQGGDEVTNDGNGRAEDPQF